MDVSQNVRLVFELFESSGIAVVGLDAENRVVEANRNVLAYLGLDPAEIVGHDVAILQPAIRSAEFWRHLPNTFYCLAPGPEGLLLIVARRLGVEHDPRLRRAIILRPYSLEREFGRMRVCLNNYLAHEVASRLNSIGIASEFITDPELRESAETRAAFISSFRHDVSELNTLFVQLLETAEQLALPNRVVRSPVDWKALVDDLGGRIRGLASERSVGLSSSLPPHLPMPSGDYQWLYLGLFGVLSHALGAAAALSEVTLSVRAVDRRLETVIAVRASGELQPAAWPPPALFPLEESHPRIGRLEITELAVSRAIFLLHGGDVLAACAGEHLEYTVILPT
jgi:signal transduction histidine kinase